MVLLLNSLWVSQVNGGALCDKSLISTCNARAVQLTSTLISHELWPLLWFIKQINHTSQALIYLLLLFKCSERENTLYVFHPSSSCREMASVPQFKSQIKIHLILGLARSWNGQCPWQPEGSLLLLSMGTGDRPGHYKQRSERFILQNFGWDNLKKSFAVCSTEEILTPAQCLQWPSLYPICLLFRTLQCW